MRPSAPTGVVCSPRLNLTGYERPPTLVSGCARARTSRRPEAHPARLPSVEANLTWPWMAASCGGTLPPQRPKLDRRANRGRVHIHAWTSRGTYRPPTRDWESANNAGGSGRAPAATGQCVDRDHTRQCRPPSPHPGSHCLPGVKADRSGGFHIEAGGWSAHVLISDPRTCWVGCVNLGGCLASAALRSIWLKLGDGPIASAVASLGQVTYETPHEPKNAASTVDGQRQRSRPPFEPVRNPCTAPGGMKTKVPGPIPSAGSASV